MRVYLDSSALIKRSIDEPESNALEAALKRHIQLRDTLTSSSLAWVEVSRAIRLRVDSEKPARVAELVELALSAVDESPFDEAVVGLARRIGPGSLRSLDAIHLATAILVDADLVIAYDERLIAAAQEMGLRTASPRGQDAPEV